ncbi:MAG: zinc ABC transporter substrate-binding protein [Clostridia bacterium]|nr:zinc ABC transporter substrate-binding protein [Clostridia bacterium]
MKKTFCFLLAVAVFFVFSAFSLASCGKKQLYSEGDGKLEVLCTVFAPFDFARVIGGDRVTVTLLQDSGADLHNYTPTAATLEALSIANAFIYIGGVSDEAWVDSAISAAGNSKLHALCLMDLTEPVYTELENDWSDHVHGEHEHEHEHEHDHEHDHEHEADEHIWTSLRNAVECVFAICELFCQIDPDGAEVYQRNAADYAAQLSALDAEYARFAESNGGRVSVFADRFPFVYLMHDYKIPYVAAFSGCSTEVNASFEMQINLINTVREHELSYVIVTEGNDKSLAEAVARETGCRIVSLNSLQSVKRSDIVGGISYLEIMQSNLEILKEASLWN